MSEPLAIVPLAAAARGGSIDSTDARQLVAAGITMLQRCALLVRALAPGRGALLLPDSQAYLVALAACEGRGAVLLDANSSPAEIENVVTVSDARVVFTLEHFDAALPRSLPRVFLDDSPGHATYVHLAEHRVVDLGSHFGFSIEGEGDIDGRDEEAVVARNSASGEIVALTHRSLLSGARAVAAAATLSADDRVLAALPFSSPLGLAVSLIAPLLAGAHVTTLPAFTAHGASQAAGPTVAGLTVIVGAPESYRAILAALRAGQLPLDASALRLALVVGGSQQPGLREEWRRSTGVELRDLSGIPELVTSQLPTTQDLRL